MFCLLGFFKEKEFHCLLDINALKDLLPELYKSFLVIISFYLSCSYGVLSPFCFRALQLLEVQYSSLLIAMD